MNIVLGLDVSTSKIGLSIMDYDQNLIDCQVLKLDNKISLEERCLEIEDALKYYKRIPSYNIIKI